MKVIVAGGSGFVGGEVIRQAIADEKITQIFALTRKSLPEDLTKSEKVTAIQHQDFLVYPPELLAQLAGAEACFWSLGGRAYQFPDVETAKKVSVDFTVAAAKAFVEVLAPQLPESKKFRFVFCSGKWAEWDQDKNLSFFKDTRRIKGLVEKELCDVADANKDRFEVWAVRPSVITKKYPTLVNGLMVHTMGSIPVDHLAKAMLKIAFEGYKDHIIEYEALLKI
ncbi:uncharacterized protein F4822DRAFT_422694 [Hypoxylon trugodes]|uniref:uncharacterized protein n=1 Tax=Hypoxylon trugodes TaxID=326681 RepID=UPI00219F3AAE|nr:uncharacterized protein F4822DRAFT_422694 [Hypoxylon trugodes]KAI1382819.1 hypothetical protein F4822DRAFT_422694 [Hypoxylon trugodes]